MNSLALEDRVPMAIPVTMAMAMHCSRLYFVQSCGIFIERQQNAK